MFIVSKDIPVEALHNLQDLDDVILFETNGITYKAVSNHPDIFICKGVDKVVVAPNIPEKYYKIIDESANVIKGEKEVKNRYPYSAVYNAVITEKYIIHSKKITDNKIKETFPNHEIINVKQGYTRCSLLALDDKNYLTSDNGILKVLKEYGFNVLYVEPGEILLPGFKNGFFGGTAGMLGDKVLLTGSLKYINGGEEVKHFIKSAGFDLLELYDGPLFDGGSIISI